MTQIVFHVNVADPLPYACRLLRKAYRVGARVQVVGPADTLEKLDALLWTFDALEFIPHAMAQGPEMEGSQDSMTPIWLCEQATPALGGATVLLSLAQEPAEGVDRFEKLIDLVPASQVEREAGRKRWRHYVNAGYAPQKVESNQSAMPAFQSEPPPSFLM